MQQIKNGENLEPKAVWKIFDEILKVPRPSKHEEMAIEFSKNFGEKLGLETIIDDIGNVIIKKPATPGMEDRKTVVLQSHLDMVPQKNNDVKHDFEKDPISAYVDGNILTANGTTLGADDGIGIAASFAILESNEIVHGPIEVLLTRDEETGMTGAFGLQADVLNADILLNLDSEDEGILYIGSAGGIDSDITMYYRQEQVPDNSISYKIEVKGLKGGHSGDDIILERGNANKLINRLMWEVSSKIDICLSTIDGGGLRNAIPREAIAIVTVLKEDEKEFKDIILQVSDLIKKELNYVDPNLEINIIACDMPKTVMDNKSFHNLLNAVYACPNGIMRMSDGISDLVETSNNLGLIKSENGEVKITCLTRSSVTSAKRNVCNMIRSAFELGLGEVKQLGSYPGWKPNLDSEILTIMKNVYKDMYKKDAKVQAIHAGLECALLKNHYPNMDMISFGPTITSNHSPDEFVEIDSVQKFWDFLLETLKHIPKK